MGLGACVSRLCVRGQTVNTMRLGCLVFSLCEIKPSKGEPASEEVIIVDN